MPTTDDTRLNRLNALKLSDNFSLHEFECKGGDCCGYSVKVYPRIIDYLEQLRAALSAHTGVDTVLHIESGYRCIKHNRAVGGLHHSDDPRDGLNSLHCRGRAVDLSSPGISKILVARLALDIWPRVGLYWKVQRSRRHPYSHTVLVLHCDLGDPARPELPVKFGNAWPT